jgi:hypothetical protein
MKRVAILLLFGILAAATTVKPMSIEDLTAASSSVVVGQAAESWSTWNVQHTLIYTFTRFHVTRSLKGSADQVITVKQLGGSAGGYTQKIAGVHPMRSGDAAVLFLRPSEAKDGTMVIVGLMQGNFRLERDTRTGATVVNNGVADVHASSSTGVSDYRGSKLTLGQLETRVRKGTNE